MLDITYYLNTRTLFYLTTAITPHTQDLAWRQNGRRSPLFQFTKTRGPRVLVHCIVVNLGVLILVFNSLKLNGYSIHRHVLHYNILRSAHTLYLRVLYELRTNSYYFPIEP